jgi:4-amino-4-deoxychorismate lyase
VSWVFCLDRFLPTQEAKISIFNQGFLFGDGVFTTLRVENGYIHSLHPHLKKLQTQCKSIKLDFPIFTENVIQELIEVNKAHKGVWRLKLIAACSEEKAPRLLSPRKSILCMTIEPYEGLFCQPMRLTLYPFPYQSSLAKIKSLAYLERLKIKDFAVSNGYDEAIVLNPDLFFLETAFANLFWKDEEGLHVPDLGLPYYEGVTLERGVAIASDLGLKILYERAKSIKSSSQVYVCSSMIGFCPVIEINGLKFSRDISFENQIGSHTGCS